MDEYQKKGDRKWAICKCMKRKHENSSGDPRGVSSRKGIVGVHLGSFCKNGEQRTYDRLPRKWGMRKNLTQRRGVNRGFVEEPSDEDGEPESHGKIARLNS
jgi:hypothetical protein